MKKNEVTEIAKYLEKKDLRKQIIKTEREKSPNLMRNLTAKLKSGLQIPIAFLLPFEVKIMNGNTKQNTAPAI